MKKMPAWRRLIVPAGLVVVGGGAALLITSSSFTQVRGATRSRRLEFERRQDVIEQAICEANSAGTDSPAVSPYPDK